MATAFGILGILLASFIKGAIGFGFPAVSTPILALFMDVKRAVAILIVPNLVMDGIQTLRRPGLLQTLRRHAVLYGCGIVGTFLGTQLLTMVSGQVALLILGAFVIAFVAVNASRFTLRVEPRWEQVLSPPVGLFAGVLGGITNVPGTPLVLYFYALGMDKAEFVRSISLSFVVYKTTQLLAVTQAGLMTAGLFALSLVATALGLGAFWCGLRVQDRVAQETFNRAVLGFLAVLGAWLVIRAL
jgi:uncharacterized membrane protein YfcA